MYEQSLLLIDEFHWTWQELRAQPAQLIRDLDQMRGVRAQVRGQRDP